MGGRASEGQSRYQRVFLTLRQASLSIRLLTTESSPPSTTTPSGQYIVIRGNYYFLGRDDYDSPSWVACFGSIA